MSSSSSSADQKEREILERQRRLAAQFNNKPVAVDQNHNVNTNIKKKPPPPPKQPYHRPHSSSVSSQPSQKTAANTNSRNRTNQLSTIIDLTEDSPKKPPPSTTMTTQTSRTTTTNSTTAHKRPHSSSNKTAVSILAAARAKAAVSSLVQEQPPPHHPTGSSGTTAKPDSTRHVTNDETVRTKPSPKVQRKAVLQLPNGATTTSSLTLASLVQHVVATTQGEQHHSDGPATTNGDLTHSTIPPVQPDDFWKNLRDWDLLSQYYYETQLQLLQQQQPPPPSDGAATTAAAPLEKQSPPPSRPPLPDTFINARHYIASWAPLCLAECRSQLLQEFVTAHSSNMTHPILVQVESTHPYHHHPKSRRNGNPSKDPYETSSWLDEQETAGYVKITCPKNAPSGGGSMTFFQNDIILLVQEPHRDILRNIGNGTQRPTNQSGFNKNNPSGNDSTDIPTNAFLGISLIGHTETTRRELDGLILKVSKRKWTKYGTKQMYFMKLGSNVTAIREFTALCGMSTLPMSSFLLGLHLQKAEHRRKLSRNQPMEQLISQMGGVEKLGDGFIQYACQKYNQSQLTAIAASAHEYGEGGFTLIKGPPGTGSRYRL